LEPPEGVLPDRCDLRSGTVSNVLGGLVEAGAARALSRVPGFDLVHLVATRVMVQGGPVGGVVLVSFNV
jgi:hypothetical protein